MGAFGASSFAVLEDAAAADDAGSGGGGGNGGVEMLHGAVALDTTQTERTAEIQRIARSMEEVSAIFKELAVLVIDQVSRAVAVALARRPSTPRGVLTPPQGTVLDRIDYNMEIVYERTSAGVAQLEQAEASQRGSRGTLLRIIITLMVLITLVLCWIIYRDFGRRR